MKETWVAVWKAPDRPSSWGFSNARFFWSIMTLKQRTASFSIILRSSWIDTVFCPPLPCRTHQEGRFKWWKELGSQGIHKNKCFSLCSGWLTGGNTFKVAVTIYVHDAVEREVTLKMKGLWDRDKRYQGMAVTNGGSLGV